MTTCGGDRASEGMTSYTTHKAPLGSSQVTSASYTRTAGSNCPKAKYHSIITTAWEYLCPEGCCSESTSCVFPPCCSVPSCCWGQQPELIQAGIRTRGTERLCCFAKVVFDLGSLTEPGGPDRDIFIQIAGGALCPYTRKAAYGKEQQAAASQVSQKWRTRWEFKRHEHDFIQGFTCLTNDSEWCYSVG